jgi:DNA repair exonuclease SbcCD ATPase subunit
MALNDSLEALKSFVAEAAQAAARVTKNAAAVTKSNINILTEQDKQKKAYLELGKLYYRDYITGEEPDDAEYLPLCEAITEAAKNIEALRGEVETAKANFKPAKEEEAEEPVNFEEELENLHKELDELGENLAKLEKVEAEASEKLEDVEQAVDAVFEVVDDSPCAACETPEACEGCEAKPEE